MNVAVSIILDNPDATFNYFSGTSSTGDRPTSKIESSNGSDQTSYEDQELVHEGSGREIGSSDEMAPRRDTLRPALGRLLSEHSVPDDNIDEVMDILERAIGIVREDRAISSRTKINRINFFSVPPDI